MEKELDKILRWIRNNFMVSTGLLMLGFGAIDWDRDLVGFGIFMVILGVLFDDSDEED